jgi:galactonate dehydratase
MNRRTFLETTAAAAAGAAFSIPRLLDAAPKLRVTEFELIPVRATARTVWLFVRLRTDAGLTGVGEASDAFGFANTTAADAARMKSELRGFFELIDGKSPLEIGEYRRRGDPLARRGGLVSATAFSAIEQALWDLSGKALDVPVHSLFGGKLRDTLPVYANINRATTARTPAGFAATARAAVKEGFRAVKGAPWDGFPPPGSATAAIEAAVDNGIACAAAMRDAVGPDVDVMVDCHSFFDVPLAERVARRLEPLKLAWYEEPVAPERIEETREIRRRISQAMAAGEVLYGVSGFAPLCRNRTVHVIMLLELTHIAAAAEQDGVEVAPHNPSGPVSTAASAQVCAVLGNFKLLEFQWGEVDWRRDVVVPPEHFDRGTLQVGSRPGLGIELNDRVVRGKPSA